MSKKKKKKQKVNKPQLSGLDKFIYNFIFVIWIGVVYILVVNIFTLLNKLYFLQENVIAATPRLTIISAFPFLLILLLKPASILIENQTKHKAIFGNKSVDYRRYSSELRPIFGKERNKAFTDKQKNARKKRSLAWFIALSVLGILSVPGILGRTVLTTDGNIITYSIFNNAKEEIKISDISKIEYSTYYSSGGRYGPDTYDYDIEIYISDSDDSYSFDNNSFKTTKQNGISTALTEMLRLKEEVYKNKAIVFDIQTELDVISRHNKLNEEENKLLYKLFDKTECT